MYNGFDWYGRTLKVREDRYAGLTRPSSYRGGLRGGIRGSFHGGYAGGAAAGRDFSSQDLYADYSGPDQQGGMRMSGYSGGEAYGGAGYNGFEPEPSQQIMVRNVSAFVVETGYIVDTG